MFVKSRSDIAALRHHLEALLSRISNHRLDQPGGNAAPADCGRDQRVCGHPRAATLYPCQMPDMVATCDMGVIFAVGAVVVAGYGDVVQGVVPAGA